jgi:hypothetical protein
MISTGPSSHFCFVGRDRGDAVDAGPVGLVHIAHLLQREIDAGRIDVRVADARQPGADRRHVALILLDDIGVLPRKGRVGQDGLQELGGRIELVLGIFGGGHQGILSVTRPATPTVYERTY